MKLWKCSVLLLQTFFSSSTCDIASKLTLSLCENTETTCILPVWWMRNVLIRYVAMLQCSVFLKSIVQMLKIRSLTPEEPPEDPTLW
jgi:hypothetical protein